MTGKAGGSHLAALACGAVMLLAGCGTTSVDSSRSPGGSTSATGAAATTTARTDGASAAPQPGPGDDGATTPANTAPGTPAPATTAAGSPSTTTASATSTVWDACSLSESALAAAGLDTATKERVSDATFPAWRSCKWQSADRTFELFVTAYDRPLEVQLEPARYQDVRRTEYYGRQVIQYRAAQDTHKQGCYVGTPAAFGSIEFLVHNTRVQTDVGDPCADANRVGAALFRSLP
ncbi:DUF3558 family protein [Nocardia sp. NPDC101769]|uniref:DUF3558 family protein n=1 Tax=Nocardia sp. NPDC101769 TaxID=3364333 RepID=UPI00381D894F